MTTTIDPDLGRRGAATAEVSVQFDPALGTCFVTYGRSGPAGANQLRPSPGVVLVADALDPRMPLAAGMVLSLDGAVPADGIELVEVLFGAPARTCLEAGNSDTVAYLPEASSRRDALLALIALEGAAEILAPISGVEAAILAIRAGLDDYARRRAAMAARIIRLLPHPDALVALLGRESEREGARRALRRAVTILQDLTDARLGALGDALAGEVEKEPLEAIDLTALLTMLPAPATAGKSEAVRTLASDYFGPDVGLDSEIEVWAEDVRAVGSRLDSHRATLRLYRTRRPCGALWVAVTSEEDDLLFQSRIDPSSWEQVRDGWRREQEILLGSTGSSVRVSTERWQRPPTPEMVAEKMGRAASRKLGALHGNRSLADAAMWSELGRQWEQCAESWRRAGNPVCRLTALAIASYCCDRGGLDRVAERIRGDIARIVGVSLPRSAGPKAGSSWSPSPPLEARDQGLTAVLQPIVWSWVAEVLKRVGGNRDAVGQLSLADVEVMVESAGGDILGRVAKVLGSLALVGLEVEANPTRALQRWRHVLETEGEILNQHLDDDERAVVYRLVDQMAVLAEADLASDEIGDGAENEG